MTPTQLAEIEARAKAATEGPWQWGWRKDDETWPGSVYSMMHVGLARAIAMCPRYGKKDFKKDAEFIARARQDIPDLIAHIRELQAQNQDLVNRLADFTSGDYT